MGSRAGMYGGGKSRHHQDLIRGLSSPKRVAVPNELLQPTVKLTTVILVTKVFMYVGLHVKCLVTFC